MKVELLFFKGCPNISLARKNLEQAFAKTGVTPQWEEIDLNEPNTPKNLKGYGSPTILVDGKDVTANESEGEGLSCCTSLNCRTYFNAEGRITGAPDAEIIAKAISEAIKKGQKTQKGKALLSIIIALFIVFAAASASLAAIFYPAPSFDLKEVVENGENVSLDKILKDKDTRGVMLYFMTTW